MRLRSGRTRSLSAPGNQRVHQLDHRDLRAEGVVHRRHLQPDDAAADDQQALRDLGQLERAGGIDDALVVVRKAGDARDARAGGDDAMVEARPSSRPRASRTSMHVRRGELRRSLHHLHLALLREPGETLGELAHDAVLPRAQLVELDLRACRTRCRRARPRPPRDSTLATCSSAFDGMQPTLRHTPPSVG